jgi:hypothetical protein
LSHAEYSQPRRDHAAAGAKRLWRLHFFEDLAFLKLEVFFADQTGDKEPFDLLEFGDGILGFFVFRRGFGHGLGALSGEEGLEIEILSGRGRGFAAFGEHVGGVGEIEDGEVDPFVG